VARISLVRLVSEHHFSGRSELCNANQKAVSYADFILVSMMHFIKRVSEDHFKKLMSLDDAFPKLFEASKQWLERED
jgi:hypothetical protein